MPEAAYAAALVGNAALVRTGELRAMKVGGRGQWRVETSELEDYIQRAYASTEKYLANNEAATEDTH